MRIIGLTGSIGMGKSATSALFREFGVLVHDSDMAVHEIYAGPQAAPVAAAFPQALGAQGIDRKKLGDIVLKDPEAMRRLESLVHPLVSAHREKFLLDAKKSGARFVVCDVPLLFETGIDEQMDVIIVVSAPFDVQKTRVLQRYGMTQAKFDAILAKQIPDDIKRQKAHFVVDTSEGFDQARQQIARLLRALV